MVRVFLAPVGKNPWLGFICPLMRTKSPAEVVLFALSCRQLRAIFLTGSSNVKSALCVASSRRERGSRYDGGRATTFIESSGRRRLPCPPPGMGIAGLKAGATSHGGLTERRARRCRAVNQDPGMEV